MKDFISSRPSYPHLRFIFQLFIGHGYRIKLAGGAVRDILLKIEPNDYDLATDASPYQIKSLLVSQPSIIVYTTDAGIEHGTVGATFDRKTRFEITTINFDKRTQRSATVSASESWKMDALRRDLTINSMFMSLDGKVDDFCYAMYDLFEGIIRFVGSPAEKIKEDYLRILRYFRFYCAYGKRDHLHESLQAITEHRAGLQSIPGERIWSELKKILTHKNADKVIPLMIELGLGKYMGLNRLKKFDHFKQVHQHLWAMHKKIDPSTLWACLVCGSDELERTATRLKLANSERSNMATVLARLEIGLSIASVLQ